MMPKVTKPKFDFDWQEVQRAMEENVSRLRKAMIWANSYERLPLLLDWSADVPSADWLRVLGEEWDGFDNIGHHADQLLDTFFSHVYHDGLVVEMMDDAEREAFAQLPDVLTIYRGCYAVNKWGFSWSLDRDIAERFPFTNRYGGEGRPLLVKASIHKSKVIALKLSRGEAEIVAFQRPKCISISTARNWRALKKEIEAARIQHDVLEVAHAV
jgi:hypothetical protein